MKRVVKEAGLPTTVEEYIQYELRAERRHEWINGQLFEMPGEKDTNNEIGLNLYVVLRQALREKQCAVYANEVKVAIPGGQKYYYPDVFATREPREVSNHYIKYKPELIVEVLSPSTYRTDTIDKYIAYTTIPSLRYYLIIDPETTYVILHARDTGDDWDTTTYTKLTDQISFASFDILLRVEDIYKFA